MAITFGSEKSGPLIMFASKMLVLQAINTATEAMRVATEALNMAKQTNREHLLHSDACGKKSDRLEKSLTEHKADMKSMHEMTQNQIATLHAENKSKIAWLFGVIWSTALCIIAGLGYLLFLFLQQGGTFPK